MVVYRGMRKSVFSRTVCWLVVVTVVIALLATGAYFKSAPGETSLRGDGGQIAEVVRALPGVVDVRVDTFVGYSFFMPSRLTLVVQLEPEAPAEQVLAAAGAAAARLRAERRLVTPALTLSRGTPGALAPTFETVGLPEPDVLDQEIRSWLGLDARYPGAVARLEAASKETRREYRVRQEGPGTPAQLDEVVALSGPALPAVEYTEWSAGFDGDEVMYGAGSRAPAPATAMAAMRDVAGLATGAGAAGTRGISARWEDGPYLGEPSRLEVEVTLRPGEPGGTAGAPIAPGLYGSPAFDLGKDYREVLRASGVMFTLSVRVGDESEFLRDERLR